MSPKRLFIASIINAFMIILVTFIWGVKIAFPLFLLGALILYIYVKKASGKHNIYFLLFLLTSMISEVLFLYDFTSHQSWITLGSVLSNIALLFLMKPIINKRNRSFSKHNIIELIVGFIGIGYSIGFIALRVVPYMPEISLFILATISFSITVSVCFLIPNFHLHPDNSLLFIIGGAYVAEMCFGFIYLFLYPEIVILLISVLAGSAVKIVLAKYLTRFEVIEKEGTFKQFVN